MKISHKYQGKNYDLELPWQATTEYVNVYAFSIVDNKRARCTFEMSHILYGQIKEMYDKGDINSNLLDFLCNEAMMSFKKLVKNTQK